MYKSGCNFMCPDELFYDHILSVPCGVVLNVTFPPAVAQYSTALSLYLNTDTLLVMYVDCGSWARHLLGKEYGFMYSVYFFFILLEKH